MHPNQIAQWQKQLLEQTQEVYRKAYDCMRDTWNRLKDSFHYYSHRRQQPGLDGRTPDEVYVGILSQTPVAA